MADIIEAPTKCELCGVIRFLFAEGHNAADIHHQMSNVYVSKVMSDGCV